MKKTTNYQLNKIELTDSPPDITVLNPNWDTIDQKMKENEEIETGQRTINQSSTPSGNTGTLQNILNWFANRIRAITGKTNWWSSPDITLADTKTHVDATTEAHGGIVASSEVVTTAQANKILKLNAQGKLPASITGDANSIGGKTLNDLEDLYMHAQKVYGSVTYNEQFAAYETKTKYINLPNNKYKNGMLTYADMIAFFGTDYTKTKCVGAYYGWNGTFPSAWNGFVSRRYGDTGAYGSRNWIGIEQFVIEGDKIKVVLKNSDDESHTESLTINWEVW